MPHTPFPWAVGNGCVIAPSVPYAESRERAYDELRRLRNPRAQTSFDYYGGEMVCESCNFEDQVAIATTTRQVTLLMGFAERIAKHSTDELATKMASALLIVCASIDKTVREEAAEQRERAQYAQYARETDYMQERGVVGLLPSHCPIPPADPYTPSHLYVIDNIELMYEIRRRAREFRCSPDFVGKLMGTLLGQLPAEEMPF